MNKTKIEWADYTWNPVVGCKRGCNYCYACRIHQRFSKTPFHELQFFPERLSDPLKVKKPSRIFVGSMSDVYFWKAEWVHAVQDVCSKAPQHTFMFLTKDPMAYVYDFINWPQNTMQGLTMEKCDNSHKYTDLEVLEMLPRPFISFEPLLGCLDVPISEKVELVIVGAMTGPGAIAPKRAWIESIKRHVSVEKIFWKENIKPFLQEEVTK